MNFASTMSSTTFVFQVPHSSTTQVPHARFLGESVELNFTIIFLANGKQLLYKLWNAIQSSSKLHFKNTKDARVLADILDLLGRRTFPPTEKTLSTGEPDATTQNTFLINSAMQGRSLSCNFGIQQIDICQIEKVLFARTFCCDCDLCGCLDLVAHQFWFLERHMNDRCFYHIECTSIINALKFGLSAIMCGKPQPITRFLMIDAVTLAWVGWF